MNSDSLLRHYAADARSLLPGATAGVLQLMYPQLGAGVEEHSDFFAEPFGRIVRSVPQIWATILEPDAAARGRHIRDLHRDIGGVDRQGRRYHALQPDTFWWAHATFTWEIFRAVELFHPETLTRADEERLYRDTVRWYEGYGLSMRPVPPDYRSFRIRFDEICSGTLELTPTAARALDIGARGSAADLLPVLPRPLVRAADGLITPPARILLFGCLPDPVRTRFAIPWTRADRVRFAALTAAVRGGARLVPHPVNRWGVRTALRYVGAYTRPDRYRPAA
ncbi:oxygenase MpaB family protein [Nocardia mexicana]|uniref:Uncharacterized protein (DUF2236 family) n=1 Tax=Nocardia mexicana TaxID=279262 RepID=A0A370HF03_9NOCA|nr:oxygenase MpaB family protein [Nocardia mexicana]RDI55612.1 uncharacterized protein (DUF2236 family) [Nocardia mexicana]